MPWNGMEFNSIEEAYYFYSRYAKVRGFGTRKKASHYSRKISGIYKKSFVCIISEREKWEDIKRRAKYSRANTKGRR